MALTKFTKDMQVIQALDDEPNDVGGLTAAELKFKYDEGGEAVKAFLNDVLLPALDAYIARTDNPHAVTKAQVGLGFADNTADADKPISTAQQTALDGKADKTTTVNGHALSENVTVSKADVGLGNADNTSDMNKPISTAQQVALSLKANRADVLEKSNTAAFTPTENYHPSTKKYVDDVIAALVLGQVPDHSITPQKLAQQYLQAISAAADYDPTATYAVGSYCTKDGKMYKCTTAITAAEAWTAGHWVETSVAGEFAALYTALTGKAAINHTHTTQQIGAMPVSPASIELLGGSGYGGLIDFHFDGSSEDYTTRLIEGLAGRLSVIGNMDVTGNLTIGSQQAIHAGNFATYLASAKMAKIAVGSYTGNGANSFTLTFPFPVEFFTITRRNGGSCFCANKHHGFTMTCPNSMGPYMYEATITVSGNTVTITNLSYVSLNIVGEINQTGETYDYAALG